MHMLSLVLVAVAAASGSFLLILKTADRYGGLPGLAAMLVCMASITYAGIKILPGSLYDVFMLFFLSSLGLLAVLEIRRRRH